MDLYNIILEFEQFYEMKFQKPPKITKKVEENINSKLPSLNRHNSMKNKKPPKDTNTKDNSKKNSEGSKNDIM